MHVTRPARSSRWFWMVVAGLAVCLTGRIAAAQGSASGRVEVAVTDASGGVMVGVPVAIAGADEFVREATTGADGVARFELVPEGRHRLTIQTAGFEQVERSIRVRGERSRLLVKLEIAHVTEQMDVRASSATRDSRDMFTTVFTPAQIAALPDDPEEMERVLKDMAGPGAVIFVNGFRGGRLPNKAQIKEIRFRLDTLCGRVSRTGRGPD